MGRAAVSEREASRMVTYAESSVHRIIKALMRCLRGRTEVRRVLLGPLEVTPARASIRKSITKVDTVTISFLVSMEVSDSSG